AGDEDIDGNVLVERAGERATVDEDVGGCRAGADGDDGLGSADLVVNRLHSVDGFVGDRAGDHENVGVAGAALQKNAQLLGVVTRRERGNDFNVAAVATAGVHVEEPGALAARGTHQALPELHGRTP